MPEPDPLTLRRRTRPRTTMGTHSPRDLRTYLRRDHRPLRCRSEPFRASWETIPEANTKDPTPRSIRPYPKFSVLANLGRKHRTVSDRSPDLRRRQFLSCLLGKTGKSTARMQMAVVISMEER